MESTSIGIITAYYKGNKYLNEYIYSLKRALMNTAGICSCRIILVNDSPCEEINFGIDTGELEIHIIKNECNLGIHKSRIKGLEYALTQGIKYVIFLDQDDILTEDSINIFSEALLENAADIYIGNSLLEQRNWSEKWIRTRYHSERVWDLDTYVNIGTQIISPGSCLIKASAIPREWTDFPLSQNGADDFFLWILMLGRKSRAIYLDKTVYIHKYTGDNISSDTERTDESIFEFIPYLKERNIIPAAKIKLLERMIVYKAKFRKSGIFGKAIASILNFDIFIKNIWFKIQTKTGYGFNR